MSKILEYGENLYPIRRCYFCNTKFAFYRDDVFFESCINHTEKPCVICPGCFKTIVISNYDIVNWKLEWDT